MEKIRITIDTAKLPAGATFRGQNGHTYIQVDLLPRLGGADDYGNTHSVSCWDKDAHERVYVGKGKTETLPSSQAGTQQAAQQARPAPAPAPVPAQAPAPATDDTEDDLPF